MSLEIVRPRAAEARIVVGTARYVLLPLANLLTGYSVKAMERKIERGDWQEGKVWKRAPDGRIVIDVLGYQRWVEGTRAAIHEEKTEGQKALPVQMDLALKREKGDPRGRKCEGMSILRATDTASDPHDGASVGSK
jgi:hypothetical protein